LGPELIPVWIPGVDSLNFSQFSSNEKNSTLEENSKEENDFYVT